ncbi:conserved hypothetical protein [Hyphomicrobiales bacterium]|jgi:DSF synthase|nr:conserved hypothetical protein [Hyphomicrobiales bacterium]CAH1702914.1 DSF synthase [Hyphomicrobiales bacterium]
MFAWGSALLKSVAANPAQLAEDVVGMIRQHAGHLPQVELDFVSDLSLLWVTIVPEPKPIFTFELLNSLGKVQQAIMDLWGTRYLDCPVRFLAFRGRGPIFTLGGDLDFYLDCLAKNDRPAMLEYARVSGEDAARNASCLGGLTITLSTIHAKAIGGGIDAPRSCNLMIAEEQASFSYPEVKFNHFPITAIAVLGRKMGNSAALKLLHSGDELTARAFFEAGGLDEVVPNGTGVDWIEKYARDTLPIHAARLALFSAFHRRTGNMKEELQHLGEAWVDNMMRLSPTAIAKLQRIAQTQDKMLARLYAAATPAPTLAPAPEMG